ncbi:hypothetical protein [Oceanithermus sp.]|uniref:hypothetical protein n=1 Tax=Oceanithermus sp. TaxID=2268145 RepID=UPI0025FE7250|nr:hypothetical protein [Oceanithermus sp.]
MKKVQVGKTSKYEIVTRLERAGMDRELAEVLVDAASKLIPAGAMLEAGAEPLALFMSGCAAAYAQASATFMHTADQVDEDESCKGAKAETMRRVGLVLHAAAVMADALAGSVGQGEPEVPQA